MTASLAGYDGMVHELLDDAKDSIGGLALRGGLTSFLASFRNIETTTTTTWSFGGKIISQTTSTSKEFVRSAFGAIKDAPPG